jgi:hypothetical protein
MVGYRPSRPTKTQLARRPENHATCPKGLDTRADVHSKAPTASVYPQTGAVLFGRVPKIFLAPLETKNDFANFFVATEGWRPGA